MEVRIFSTSDIENLKKRKLVTDEILATDLACFLGNTSEIWLMPTGKNAGQNVVSFGFTFEGTLKQHQNVDAGFGVVPVIESDDADDLLSQDDLICGEYPQDVVSEVDTVAMLDALYEEGQLSETGKIYTFFMESQKNGGVQKVQSAEYELDGKKYIRMMSPKDAPLKHFTNGWPICSSEVYWFNVMPIKWQKDISGIAYTEKILLAGVPYDYNKAKRYYLFENSELYSYLNNSFVQEAEINKNYKLQKISSNAKQTQTSVLTQGQNVATVQNKPVKQVVKRKMTRQERYGIQVTQDPMTVTEQIDFYVKNGMSFMLHGPSGVGKTARVEQIDPDLTAVPLWNGVLPEDIVGKVRYPDGIEKAATTDVDFISGEWVAPDWYIELVKKCQKEPDKMHVLFIDEVTNARPTTQSLIFHITLKRSISPSKGKLPKNCVVVLAGNSKDESGAAYNMPEPLFRRMCGHIYLKPDVQEWLLWGTQKKQGSQDENRLNIHPLVSSFVASWGHKVFYTNYDEEDAPKWALDPRSWQQISDIIYNNNGLIQRELLASKMGNDNATTFMAFAKKPPITLDEILEGDYHKNDIPKQTDEQLALVLGLRYAEPEDLPVVRLFVKKEIGPEYLSIFDSAWVAGDGERALLLQNAINEANKAVRIQQSNQNSRNYNVYESCYLYE